MAWNDMRKLCLKMTRPVTMMALATKLRGSLGQYHPSCDCQSHRLPWQGRAETHKRSETVLLFLTFLWNNLSWNTRSYCQGVQLYGYISLIDIINTSYMINHNNHTGMWRIHCHNCPRISEIGPSTCTPPFLNNLKTSFIEAFWATQSLGWVSSLALVLPWTTWSKE